MKLGILGAGMIVQDFLTFAHKVEKLELAGICATPEEKALVKELAKKNSIVSYYTDFNEMVANREIDTIYVAVPNHLHFQFTKTALEAGKHVICEKPFTSNFEEAKELACIAQEKNLFLFEAVSTRFLPNVLKMKELLPKLGNVKIFSANYSQYSSRYDAFKNGETLPAFDPEKSGGSLMDLNIYNINLVVTLFGSPQKVDYQANIERGIDTSGVLILDYGEFKFVGIAAKDCKAPIVTNIQGDQGCIVIETSANIVDSFTLLMNTPKITGQLNETAVLGDTYKENQGKHRMHHEFDTFIKIIGSKDYQMATKLLDTTLITMDIQTKARKSAGISFPSDII